VCARSVIGDDFSRRHDHVRQWISQPIQGPGPTTAEFLALQKEVAELKKLLKAAKRYDEATGKPNCDDSEKVALLRKIAEFVGVDLADVLSDKAA
jgi:hypothetical protein